MLGFEITLFNIIGVCFLLCAALTFVIPVLVWAGNSICSLLWHFVDEGETAFRHRFTNTYLTTPETSEQVDRYLFKLRGDYYDRNDGKFWDQKYGGSFFISKDEAEKIASSRNGAEVETMTRTITTPVGLAKHVIIIPICGVLGAGFICIPTITLVAGSAALSLYAMRWSRRAVKRSKKLDEMLSSHVQDPNAHKQASE